VSKRIEEELVNEEEKDKTLPPKPKPNKSRRDSLSALSFIKPLGES
jgi:hypothetical protein